MAAVHGVRGQNCHSEITVMPLESRMVYIPSGYLTPEKYISISESNRSAYAAGLVNGMLLVPQVVEVEYAPTAWLVPPNWISKLRTRDDEPSSERHHFQTHQRPTGRMALRF